MYSVLEFLYKAFLSGYVRRSTLRVPDCFLQGFSEVEHQANPTYECSFTRTYPSVPRGNQKTRKIPFFVYFRFKMSDQVRGQGTGRRKNAAYFICEYFKEDCNDAIGP